MKSDGGFGMVQRRSWGYARRE